MESINIKNAAKNEVEISLIFFLPSLRSRPASSTIITVPITPKKSIAFEGMGMCQLFASDTARKTMPAANSNKTEGIFMKFDIIEKRYDITITPLNKIKTHSLDIFCIHNIYPAIASIKV